MRWGGVRRGGSEERRTEGVGNIIIVILCPTHISIPPYPQTDTGVSFSVRCRMDTDVELAYYRHGGILNYMIRKVCQ